MRSSLLLILAGCSLGNAKPERCTTSSDCSDAFGFGFQCGTDGYCENLVVPERCAEEPVPRDLFTNPEEHRDIVLMGSLFDRSSDLDNIRSVELAFLEANVGGVGLAGREIGLVNCTYGPGVDNDDQATAAVSVLDWMSESLGIKGVVGPATSQVVFDVEGPMFDNEMLLIAPSTTSDELIGYGTSPNNDVDLFWRTAPSDALQASTIALDLATRGSTNVAIISQVGSYGDGLSERLRTAIDVPANRVFNYANSNELTAAIADVSVLADLDEVIFVSSSPIEISNFLNGASAVAAYDTLPIFLTDTARQAEVLTLAAVAQPLFPNIRGTNPVPDPANADLEGFFFVAYRANFSEDPTNNGYNSFSYDAGWLALYSLAWAANQEADLSGQSLARGLEQVSSGTPIDIRGVTWDDVQAEFAAGRSVDVSGASGELDFDTPDGDPRTPIAVWVVNPAGTGFVDEAICYDDGTCIPSAQ